MQASVRKVSPPSGDEDPPSSGFGAASGGAPAPGEDLPYKVEVWNAAGEDVERVVAVTASATVGYAAYYAAATENFGRVVTLTFKGRVMSKWSHRAH